VSKRFVSTAREGTLLNIHVSPGAKSTSVEGLYGEGAIKLKVAAPPVGGKANAEVERFLSKLLGVPRSDINIIRGASSRDKTVLVRGTTRAETHEALAAHLPSIPCRSTAST
jgi:uncharacterized protein (TIGR00251 family)